MGYFYVANGMQVVTDKSPNDSRFYHYFAIISTD